MGTNDKPAKTSTAITTVRFILPPKKETYSASSHHVWEREKVHPPNQKGSWKRDEAYLDQSLRHQEVMTGDFGMDVGSERRCPRFHITQVLVKRQQAVSSRTDNSQIHRLAPDVARVFLGRIDKLSA